MIDLHTHILWDIDDGSKSIDMTTAMLDIAALNGTTVIFATPHVIELANKPSWELIVEKSKQIQQIADNKKINIKIYPGAEIQMNWDLLSEIGENGAYCLIGGRYVLVELPVLEIPEYADEFFYRLTLDGLIPIIAHPERYSFLNTDNDSVVQLLENGCRFQLNKDSILGRNGQPSKNFAFWMLENGYAQIIASDCHNALTRNSDLGEVYFSLLDTFTESRLNEFLHDNPKRVLLNFDI